VLALSHRPLLPSALSSTSASGLGLSQLNGWPARSPVNASPTPSRVLTHDSGASVVRYSFTARDLHSLLFAGFAGALITSFIWYNGSTYGRLIMITASTKGKERDTWILRILGGIVMLSAGIQNPASVVWIESTILGAYVLDIAAWLAFNRWRCGRWISWGGRELTRRNLLFYALILAPFAGMAIARPLGFMRPWVVILMLIWVLGVIVVFDKLLRLDAERARG
jgi:hypothetical protein